VDVVALSGDLMDRSRITAAIGGVRFARRAEDAAGADVVIVDLARHAADVATIRGLVPNARIVAFGSHVDEHAADQARRAGADLVLARSRFFHDPAASIV
jgi:DNA-binding NarL/FixJ family response regulator